jgi:hypothetical protein
VDHKPRTGEAQQQAARRINNPPQVKQPAPQSSAAGASPHSGFRVCSNASTRRLKLSSTGLFESPATRASRMPEACLTTGREDQSPRPSRTRPISVKIRPVVRKYLPGSSTDLTFDYVVPTPKDSIKFV